MLDDVKFLSIIVTYNRWESLEKSFSALTKQSYKNLDIVVVNNGSNYDVKKKLKKFFPGVANYSVINFPVNIFDLDNLWVLYKFVYNSAIYNRQYDYAFIQSDDDFLDKDFYSHIYESVIKNSSPGALIGVPFDYYYESEKVVNINHPKIDKLKEYYSGFDYVSQFMSSYEKDGLNNPGFSYVLRKDILIESNGFAGGTSSFELHQILSVLPFVDVVISKEAKMYWGRHDSQTHLELNNNCFNETNEFKKLISLYRKKWLKIFGNKTTLIFDHYMSYLILEENLKNLRCGIKQKSIKTILFSLINLFNNKSFWKKIILLIPKKFIKWVNELFRRK